MHMDRLQRFATEYRYYLMIYYRILAHTTHTKKKTLLVMYQSLDRTRLTFNFLIYEIIWICRLQWPGYNQNMGDIQIFQCILIASNTNRTQEDILRHQNTSHSMKNWKQNKGTTNILKKSIILLHEIKAQQGTALSFCLAWEPSLFILI